MGEICERSERATENKKKRLGGNFKFSGCGPFAINCNLTQCAIKKIMKKNLMSKQTVIFSMHSSLEESAESNNQKV